MNVEKHDLGPDSPERRITFSPPAAELLTDPDRARDAWPERVTGDPAFLGQIEKRKELNAHLEAVFSRTPPDTPLAEAIAERSVSEEQAAELYDSLADLLADRDYQRAALYLPFELLPNASWKPTSDRLHSAAGRFREAYQNAWHSLLGVHDVRANFVDGDVLEVDRREGDPPRVVKAAHLIPRLIEAGYLKLEDAVRLVETSDDETLKRSVADTLPVLADLGLIGGAELARMNASADATVREAAAAIAASPETPKNEPRIPTEEELASLEGRLRDEFSRIDAEDEGDVTEKRAAWLKDEKRRNAVESASGTIADAMTAGAFTDEQAHRLSADGADTAAQRAFIGGAMQAIESRPKNPERAKALFARYRPMVEPLLRCNEPAVRDAATKAFYHFRGLGLMTDEELAALQIAIPDLAGSFSRNIEHMAEDMDAIRAGVAGVESDPALAGRLYPVALVFGSRLKGYGKPDADLDVGVVVRPATPFGERSELRAPLDRAFGHARVHGEAVEFWLEETPEGLRVQNRGETDPTLGDGTWSHVLFGAAWEGDDDAIRELREKLLVPYFSAAREKETIHGRAARGLYIEELERDTLQYRLMHKGYERFFPPRGGIRTPHADRIDGASTFWDPGYRRLATQLYARRVFLPKLSR